jgi:hypothetical protein
MLLARAQRGYKTHHTWRPHSGRMYFRFKGSGIMVRSSVVREFGMLRFGILVNKGLMF